MMRLLSNRTSGEELQPGDHIYSYRKGHTYSHHGIYVGEGWVIHFTATDEPITTSSTEPRCRSCGHDPNTKRGVLKTCVDCFLKGHGLLCFEYNVSLSRFILKQKGSCSTESCYPSDKTVRLATEIFKKDEVDGTGFGEYNLFNNNCENFASYCKTGCQGNGYFGCFQQRYSIHSYFQDFSSSFRGCVFTFFQVFFVMILC